MIMRKLLVTAVTVPTLILGGGVAYAATPHTSHHASQACPTTSVGTKVYGTKNILLKCAAEWLPVHPTPAPVKTVIKTVIKKVPGPTVTVTVTVTPTTTPPPPVAPAPPAAPTTLLSQSGNGSTDTAQFSPAGNWDINYTYDCTAFGQAGNFIVDSEGTGSGNANINQLALTGSGTDHVYGGGTYHLSIISECNWTISVVG